MMPCPAFRYHPSEQALSTRHRQERRDTKCPSRLTKDSDIIWIATKCCNILLHPCERRDLVEQTKIGNAVTHKEEAISTEAIVDGYTYNSIPGETTTVILWYCT